MRTLSIIRAPNIAVGRSIFAPNPVWVRSLLTGLCFIKSIEIRRRAKIMWKPGDIIVWRGIYRNRVWHVVTMIVVKDSPEEMVLALVPGAERMGERDNMNGKKSGSHRWDFKDKSWELEKFHWRTNRLLILLEPEKYYSTMYFWNDANNEFLCY